MQAVGVLKFVYKDVVEAVLVVPAQNFVFIQHFVAAEHEFGKVGNVFLLTLFFVFGITLYQPLRGCIGRVQAACAQAVFFLCIDEALQHARRKCVFGNVHLFEQAFD